MNTINSKSNEKVKYIKSLNEKKFRQKYNSFYVEGIKVVEEILNSNKAIDILFIAYSNELLENVNGGKRFLQKLKNIQSNFEVIKLSESVFNYVVDTKSPQGVLIVVKINKYSIDNIDLNKDIIILDKIQDLGNLGTIIRSADAFNIKNIICIEGTSDIYSPKVVRSTMGSILRENIVYLNLDQIEGLVKILKKNRYFIYSTTLTDSISIEEIKLNEKSVFIFGNEANGVSKEMEKLSDKRIKINMSTNTDSLNVSIAAGIVMYKKYIANNL